MKIIENEKEIYERITKVEIKIISLSDIIEEIKNNHLVHLADKVDRIQWLLVTTLASILTGIIVLILKK